MKRGYKVVKIAVIGILAITLFVYVTMQLWNWLVPVLFSGPVIDFWQALGLLVLSKIFFSGFSKGGQPGYGWRPYWKAKWQAMTPNERESFKQKMKEKWCRMPKADDEGISNG
jgi:hypothetical protein